ncbi:hypothetical protein L3Q67_01820 [Saccharothrix sp. AJ9571]|nr:hypothetical protein L3Q67_01820 [Saccharothrix sp. AJ9571]
MPPMLTTVDNCCVQHSHAHSDVNSCERGESQGTLGEFGSLPIKGGTVSPGSSADMPQSPLPTRTLADQQVLGKELVKLTTLANRITLLLEAHSVAYQRPDGSFETDPDVIALSEDLTARQLKVPTIASWIAERSGTNFKRANLYYLRSGERVDPSRPVLRALAAFWRLDERLLDVSVPADWLDDDALNRDGKKILAVMAQVGVTDIKARDVQNLTDGVSAASQRQLLQVLQSIAEEQAASRRRSGGKKT